MNGRDYPSPPEAALDPEWDGDELDLSETAAVQPGQQWPPPNAPLDVARELYRQTMQLGQPTILHWRGTWLRWTGKHYAAKSVQQMERDLYTRLGDATYRARTKGGEVVDAPWRPNRDSIGKVLHALAALALVDDRVQDRTWLRGAGAGAVAVRNGILDLASGEVLPHTPAFFTLGHIPHDYRPGPAGPGDCPNWTAFLERIWGHDPDAIRALRMWFGYVLSGRTDLQKMLLIVGPPRAGKGTIAGVLRALMGPDNTCSPTGDSLGTDFGLSPLIGKTLATVNDVRLSGSGGRVAGNLLTITGEDEITIDRKHMAAWTGRLGVRFMLMSNEVPTLRDASGAVVSRFVILRLTRTFLGHEDTGLQGRLAGESAGILRWALDGLRDLESAGRFAEPASAESDRRGMADLASPVSAFLREATSRVPGGTVTRQALYEAYRSWARDNGVHEASMVQFGRDLAAARPDLTEQRLRQDGLRIRVWTGILLREPGQWGDDDEDARTLPPAVPLVVAADPEQTASAAPRTPLPNPYTALCGHGMPASSCADCDGAPPIEHPF